MPITDPDERPQPPPRRRARRPARACAPRRWPPFPTLVREIPVYNIVPDEAVELIHEESMKILEEVGCEFRDDEAIAMWKAAGADVTGTRVRIDRALLMEPRRQGARRSSRSMPATPSAR